MNNLNNVNTNTGNTSANNIVNTNKTNVNTRSNNSTSPTGSSYASYIVGVSLTLGLLFIILSAAIIITYIQKRNHKKFLEKKEKEKRIRLGQSVQSLKSTNDVLNLLLDTTKSEINPHPFGDDKNIPLFQIGIYPNYSYKDLEKKYQSKSEKDISTLFEEYNNPKKSSTHPSLTNNSNVASLFKNSRLYSQTLPSMNDSIEKDQLQGKNYLHGGSSSNEFHSSSSTLRHSQYYSSQVDTSYSQSEDITESISESYDEEGTTTTTTATTDDPDKSISLSQSILTALQQNHTLR